MIVRETADGGLLLIRQTDHSQLVGQMAAHWGNSEFDRPEPYESVVRAATYHDFGYLRYETRPRLREDGKPCDFRSLPADPGQYQAYQWCIDWLSDIDPYSGLLINMHRTGLWRGRYETIGHPGNQYNPQGLRPEILEFVERNEARQEHEREGLPQEGVWTNYRLLQVWDLLGLYFCCQEPYEDRIEPVPLSANGEATTRMRMQPDSRGRVVFDPYPFDKQPLKVQILSKKLSRSTFPSEDAFRRDFFEAPNQLLEYELVAA